MKAVCILGSPKLYGNTSAIVSEIIRGLEQHDVEVSQYRLSRLDIRYCSGCMTCNTTGKCEISDDVPKVMDAIFSSRLVIVASPSYWGDVTAQMKVFIDRCTPYSNTNDARIPARSGQKGIAVAVRAGQSKQESLNLVHTIDHFLGHLDIPLLSYFTAEGINTEEDLRGNQAVLRDAYNYGDRLFDLIDWD